MKEEEARRTRAINIPASVLVQLLTTGARIVDLPDGLEICNFDGKVTIFVRHASFDLVPLNCLPPLLPFTVQTEPKRESLYHRKPLI